MRCIYYTQNLWMRLPESRSPFISQIRVGQKRSREQCWSQTSLYFSKRLSILRQCLKIMRMHKYEFGRFEKTLKLSILSTAEICLSQLRLPALFLDIRPVHPCCRSNLLTRRTVS